MSEPAIVFVVIAVVVLLMVPVVLLVSRRGSAIRDMLRGVATAAGWADVTNLKLQHGVRGIWRSFPVSFAYMARQKSTPQRLTVKIGARSDVRLVVKRRFDGFLSNKPLAWFGPRVVELHAPAAGPFWVRADEVNLAERLFAEAPIAAAIDSAIVARFDELRVTPKGLRVVRAVDQTPVREKYGFPKFSLGLEPSRFEPLAREEWNAAEAVANKLSLM